MKRIILFLIIGILFISLVSAFSINKGANVYFNCNNASSGVLLGTVANITCYNSTLNTYIATAGMTNVLTGTFNFTFRNLTKDTYTCFINCSDGAVDYFVPVEVERVTQNNLTDGIIRSSVIESGISSNASNIKSDLGGGLISNRTAIEGAVLSNKTSINTNTNAVVTNLGTNISNMFIANTSFLNAEINNVTNQVWGSTTTRTLTSFTNFLVNLSTFNFLVGLNSTGNICLKADVSSLEANISGAITGNRTLLEGTILSNKTGTITQLEGSIVSNRTQLQIDLSNTNQSIHAKFTSILAGMITNATSIYNSIIANKTGIVTDILNTNQSIQGKLDKVLANQTILNNSIGAISSGSCPTVEEIDTQLNQSHSEGNWSATSSATGFSTPADIVSAVTNLSSAISGNASYLNTEINNVSSQVWGAGTRTLTTADWTTDSDLTNVCYDSDISSAVANISGAVLSNASSIKISISNLGTNISSAIIQNVTNINTNINIVLAGIIANTTLLNSNIDNVTKEVWDYVTRSLTDENINSSLYCVNNLDKTGYALSVQDWTTDSDLTNIATKVDVSNLGTNISTMMITNVSFLNTEINNVSAQVWIYTLRGLTDEDMNSSVYCINNLDKTGYSLTTQDWTTDADIISLVINISGAVLSNKTSLETLINSNTSIILVQLNANTSKILAGQIDLTNYSRIATPENVTDVKNIANNILSNQSIIKAELDNVLANQTTLYTKIANVWSEATRTLTSFNFLVGLNSTGISDIWSSATRSLTLFDFRVRLNSTGINDITSNITSDHGTGLYNSTSSTISDSDKTDIAKRTWNNSIISQENRTVATNVTATIADSDKREIAKYTAQYEYNRTETYNNNSLGYPTNTTVVFILDNRTVNITYGYYSDNMTIKNTTYKT